jgi:Cof subfamily protein (haloacid dehalogenase superfamily)
MDRIALIALDLDGTLLTSAHSLAPEAVRLLQQAYRNGRHVVLASLRHPDSVRTFCEQLDIHDPIICHNGAYILGTPDGPVWLHLTIPQLVAHRLAQFADQRELDLAITVGETTYRRQRAGQPLGQLMVRTTIVANNSDAVVGDPVRVFVGRAEAIAPMRLFCQRELQGLVRTDIFVDSAGLPDSMAICPVASDKGTALELVRSRLGLPRESVMAIGDNFVDLPMFRSAGLSVAMANAPDEVKRQATVIAPSNDDEGVAWALRTYGVE